MGKVKKTRKSDARKSANPLTGARPKKPAAFTATPQTDELHKSRILPTVKSLAAASAVDRALALSAVCTKLLDDDTCRFLLLKERIVAKLMDDLVHDPSEDVVVLAWRALYRIAALEGYDHSVNMFRKGILSKIKAVLEKLGVRIASGAPDPDAQRIWSLTESIVGLLKCLSEESEQALDAISKMDIVPFLMGLLSPTANVPEDIQSIAAQCLSSLTEDNDDVTSKILEQHTQYVPQLMQLKDDKSPIVRMCSCAVLHNLSLAPTEIENDLSDADILPTLTALVKTTASLDLPSCHEHPSPAGDEAVLRATEIALEVIASVATLVGYELEPGAPIPDADFIDQDAKLVNGDDTGDDGDDEDQEMVDEIADLREDMDMTTVEDNNDVSVGRGTEKIIHYLLENTGPAVVLLSGPLPDSLSQIRLRALAALNNMAWTLDAAIGSRPRAQHKWNSLVKAIWNTAVAPTLTGNTADIALADAVSGVAWAVAKTSGGKLDLLGTGAGEAALHKSFIGLYQAATTDELRSKCVGVLGSLAMPQDRIDVNKDIGVFLLGLVTAAPEEPARPVVEALNAIYDVYSDCEFAYDKPVFVELGFLKHLEAAQKGVRTLVRRIDKKKFPELRERADEALMNLVRFIAYKKKERAKEGE